MRIAAVLSVLAFAAAALPAQAADPAAKDIAARIELHPIASLTLSDQQFLEGDAGGKPVLVAGALRLPRGTGRLPVVVLVHGSGGPGAGNDYWTRELAEIGVATFLLDGFTGRGLTSTSTNQALLGRLNLILDAYRALELLAKHPRIDRDRIALMGFSRGGQAALYASVKRFHAMWNKSGADFAAYMPFYPDCRTSFATETDTSASPIRIFHGAADDYNPAAPCSAFVDRIKSAGRDASITLFPGVHHAFDNPHGAVPPAISQASQSVRACEIREEPKGRLINAATGQPFTYKDSCVQTGPHLGHDRAATEASVKAVKALLQKVFKLP